MRLLVIEDDALIADAVQQALTPQGYVIDIMNTATAARGALRQGGFDLVLLDLGLPDGEGLQLLAEQRSRGDLTPVMIITARDQLDDRVQGLNLGADDYLPKPFSLIELEARARALIRRSQQRPDNELNYGPLTLYTDSGNVILNGAPLDLPQRELRLLESLLIQAGSIVPREVLESRVFGYSEVGSNALEVYISRLRKRLNGSELQIRTLRGLGYRLERPKS